MSAILVTGATGYVGGRLTPMLLDLGYRVRALVRSARKIHCRPWGRHKNLEVIEGDLHNVDSIRKAVKGCSVAYYLVHSMSSRHGDFMYADRHAAYSMVRATKDSGLERIIYLSGLLPDESYVSDHLRSRAEVSEILSLGEAKVTTLQAAQIIGSGSASFELVRYLADRLPIMITPRWVHVESQPISISNVLGYLTGVLEHPETAGETYDIGGPDVITYRQLFQIYAKEAGLRKRCVIPVPLLTPSLSALWVNFITPVPTAIARPLIEGMRNRVVCSENRIREIIPQDLLDVRATIRRAVDRVRQHAVPTCWLDAGTPDVPEWVMRGDASFAGGTVLYDSYTVRIAAQPETLWDPILHIGGEIGWYGKNILWRIRGFLDRLAGGPGLQRGRRTQDELRVGDALDFWRVIDIRPNERLLLLTEMRLPGEALLEFLITPIGKEETELTLSAYFLPRGLAGLAYWYPITPLHKMAFGGMLQAIAKEIDSPITYGPINTKVIPENFCPLPPEEE